MITSIFKRSTPFNFIVFLILITVVFTVFNYPIDKQVINLLFLRNKAVVLFLFFGTFFLINFIVKKNTLTKNSDYAVLFFFLFLLFFPAVLSNFNLVFSNLLVLLALRRLYSMPTLKVSKEKIFDASLYICLASIFQFWSILFLSVVFVSVIFYVARDYRHWFLPFVGMATAAILLVLYGLIIDKLIFLNYIKNAHIDVDFTYFKNNYQNLALSIFTVVAVFYMVSLVLALPTKPLNKKAAYKQSIFTFLVAVLVFIFSTNKSNEILLFSFFPLAIMATSDIEQYANTTRSTVILFIVVALAAVCFFTQL